MSEFFSRDARNNKRKSTTKCRSKRWGRHTIVDRLMLPREAGVFGRACFGREAGTYLLAQATNVFANARSNKNIKQVDKQLSSDNEAWRIDRVFVLETPATERKSRQQLKLDSSGEMPRCNSNDALISVPTSCPGRLQWPACFWF